MIHIDGAGGGGQFVRTAVALAAVTDTAVRITDVRAARETAGLRPQHLAAVRTVAQLCDADVSGAEVGSNVLTFRPGNLRATDVTVDIGTAGSIPLLFDAVLPLAVGIEDGCRVSTSGGTDVKWSPVIDYLKRVKLPLLGRFGFGAEIRVSRSGFYPTGGGEATLTIGPSDLEPITITDRGVREAVEIYSKAAVQLEDRAVADRQATAASDRLRAAGLDPDIVAVESVAADSPGSAILVSAEYTGSIGGADALGEPGKPAETVGTAAAEEFLMFHRRPAAVDRHMADQLMIFLALAGGRLEIPTVTDHVGANRSVIEAMGFDLTIEEHADGSATIRA